MYLEFLRSLLGAALVLVAAALVLALLLAWASNHAHPERRATLGASATLTLILGAVYVVALAAGWWRGAYFTIPPLVQAAILVSAALAGVTVWLAGYQWVSERSHQPIQIYVALSLLLALAVAAAHRVNLGQGKILLGPDWTVLFDALLVLAVLWIPILGYEALRRVLATWDPPL